MHQRYCPGGPSTGHDTLTGAPPERIRSRGGASGAPGTTACHCPLRRATGRRAPVGHRGDEPGRRGNEDRARTGRGQGRTGVSALTVSSGGPTVVAVLRSRGPPQGKAGWSVDRRTTAVRPPPSGPAATVARTATPSGPQPGPRHEEAPVAETYSGSFYCVKCKEKRDAEGGVVETNGRRMAKAKCPVCGTNLNRILGKA
nr:DUF5679 domain-containing protein [Quadrisphaera sp. RL12-1S]